MGLTEEDGEDRSNFERKGIVAGWDGLTAAK
jgi:hypothetical protein